MHTSAPVPVRRPLPLRILAIVAALAVAAGMFAFGASPAHAKVLDNPFGNWSERNGDQNPITITTDTGDLKLWERADVRANWDMTGLDPEVGDTFSLTLPPEFGIGGDTFTLTAPGDENSGDERYDIATCRVTPPSGDTPAVVTCTLIADEDHGDYWSTHSNISGSIALDVQAREETTESEVDFGVGDDTISVPLPGEEIGPPNVGPKPDEITKNGWFNNDRSQVTWRVYIPGEAIDDSALTVIDSLPEGLNFNGLEVVTFEDTQDGWVDYVNGNRDTRLTEGTDYTVTESGRNVTVEIAEPDPTRFYAIEIWTTVDPGLTVEPGDQFTNTVDVNGVRDVSTVEYRTAGSGQGQGYQNGFRVTKEFAGVDTETLGDAVFTVEYSYVPGNLPPTEENTRGGELILSAENEWTAGFAPIPTGTEVTLREIDTPTIPGITWEDPVFSGEGVTVNDDGSATFTIVEDAEVAITLTNTAAASTPTPTPSETPSDAPTVTPVPTPSDTPSDAPSASPTPSDDATNPGGPNPENPENPGGPNPENPGGPGDDDRDSSLPRTGAEATAALIGIGVLLLAIGGGALAVSRRTRTEV